MELHRTGSEDIMRMAAHVTIVRCQATHCDTFVRGYCERMLPMIRACLGYRGIYVLADSRTGDVLALSLWDTPDDATAHEQSEGCRDGFMALGYCLAAPVRTTVYEVSAQA